MRQDDRLQAAQESGRKDAGHAPCRLVVGISGASGVLLGARLLEALAARPEVETHLVATDGAWENFRRETELSRADVEALADVCYDSHDLAAPIASAAARIFFRCIVPTPIVYSPDGRSSGAGPSARIPRRRVHSIYSLSTIVFPAVCKSFAI